MITSIDNKQYFIKPLLSVIYMMTCYNSVFLYEKIKHILRYTFFCFRKIPLYKQLFWYFNVIDISNVYLKQQNKFTTLQLHKNYFLLIIQDAKGLTVIPLVALVVDCGNGLVVVVNILCCFPVTSFSVTVVVVVVAVIVVGGGAVENENGFIG